MDLVGEVARRGGLAATHELLRAGATSRLLTHAVRTGVLVRVRQGWYGLPGADPVLESAVRVGGRATCITAARELGLWVVRSPELHLRVPAHHARLREPHDHRRRLAPGRPGVRVHWGRDGVGTRHRMDAREALADMIRCQSPERVVAAADSAIRAGLLSRTAWERMIATAPRGLRRLLARVDSRSESFLESITRFRLQQLGYHPEVQASIPGVGRADLVLGRLVIELDGWEHHRSREAFEEDRRRDARLAALGYRSLRFTYRSITRRWAAALAAIRACLAVS